jgi:hypothetical protein
MKSFLETLQRKKAAQHLGQQERMIIENALYYVNPPERAAIQQKERTPVDLFVRKLVYLDMNKRTYVKVLKSIRKLHWEEPEVFIFGLMNQDNGLTMHTSRWSNFLRKSCPNLLRSSTVTFIS